MSWSRRFPDPIRIGNGRPLVTLRDAAQYILKLPKAERETARWQTAAEVLMLIGENGGDAMMAHIAMLRALDRGDRQAEPRRKRAKVYHIVR